MTKTNCTKKFCFKCEKCKPRGEFQNNKSRPDGKQTECRSCHNAAVAKKRQKPSAEVRRRYALKKDFGITLEEYDELYEQQKGKCAICGKTPDKNHRKYKLAVDHDHKTGRIRGLLCSSCNLILGHINDNIYIAQKMVQYLR